jgi:hypothetical protein
MENRKFVPCGTPEITTNFVDHGNVFSNQIVDGLFDHSLMWTESVDGRYAPEASINRGEIELWLVAVAVEVSDTLQAAKMPNATAIRLRIFIVPTLP